MLNRLLNINGVNFPNNPDSYSVDCQDTLNEFSAEDGSSIIEAVRTGRYLISVSYSNITAAKLAVLCAALDVIATVKFHEPRLNTIVTKTMQVQGIKTAKAFHKYDVSTWSLSFALKEL